MYSATKKDLACLDMAYKMIDEVYGRMGESDDYTPGADDKIHYELAKLCDDIEAMRRTLKYRKAK